MGRFCDPKDLGFAFLCVGVLPWQLHFLHFFLFILQFWFSLASDCFVLDSELRANATSSAYVCSAARPY